MQWVDLRAGQSAPTFLAEGIIEEIWGISVLANTHIPKLIGFENDEIYRYMAFVQKTFKFNTYFSLWRDFFLFHFARFPYQFFRDD